MANENIPNPKSDGALTTIWTVIILLLGVIVLVFGFWSYRQLAATPAKSAETLIGVATAALGGLLGILAPSPINKD